MMTDAEVRALAELRDARLVADYASENGFSPQHLRPSIYPKHLGAVMADAILQAGVNYRTVVKPRIVEILLHYPDAKDFDGVSEVIRNDDLAKFLNWHHFEKLNRFINLADMFQRNAIRTTNDLKKSIVKTDFKEELLRLHGIGRKTVDYMANLVGVECIAVDRHIRSFAVRCGLNVTDYDVLNRTFCFAADLLNSNRSHFDSWVWNAESNRSIGAS